MRIKLGEYLGLKECPYARRWTLESKHGTLRVHHFYRSDDERALHDHPWWFLTFVFKGGYTDVNEQGNDHLRAPAIRFRRAEHKHTVRTDPGGAWTFVISGPKKRIWGFWVPRIGEKVPRFLRNEKYFAQHGHHPCD